MSIPAELKYTKDHEWIRVEGDKAYMGITDYAQSQLGDIVFVEIPVLNATVKVGQGCAVVESVKAVSDIYSPLSGTIVEVNEELESAPELVNQEPYGAGWMCAIQYDQLPTDLLSAEEYAELIKEQFNFNIVEISPESRKLQRDNWAFYKKGGFCNEFQLFAAYG